MRMLAWLIVGVVSAVSGGYAIPLGFALGLPGVEIYLAAVIGSAIGMVVFVIVANRFEGAFEHRMPEPPSPESRLGRIIDRFGERGLGLVGPVFPGVTAALVLGFALQLKRRPLLIWLSIGVALMYAVYVGALAWLIDAVALDGDG